MIIWLLTLLLLLVVASGAAGFVFLRAFLSRKLTVRRDSSSHAFSWDSKGKTIVITGASSGIGAELARLYAKSGAKLVLSARREKELNEVAQECLKLNPDCEVLTVPNSDVSKTEDCQKLFEESKNRFGRRLDLLVLNAGISMGEAFEDVEDLSIFRRLMDVNYFGCVDCTHFALPLLKEAVRPKIAVISSGMGLFGGPTRTGYCASKYALHGFFESLRNELGPKYGFEITIICPGFVRTEIDRNRLGNHPSTIDLDKAMPLEKAGELIYRSIQRGDRQFCMTPLMQIGVWMKVLFPELLDFMAIRALKQGTITPNQEKKLN